MNSLLPSRRDVLKQGVASAAAGVALMAWPRFVFPGQQSDEELVPFLNMPRTPENRLDWEMLDSWITPQDQVFNVQHYGIPQVDAASYALHVGGLVERPISLTLDAIKARPRKEQLMTLECSGNGQSKGFMDAIYNSRWTGTPLVPLLDECGLKPQVKEIVFLGHDKQAETLRKGTPRELTVEVPFGRSMSIEDLRAKEPLLAYEREGAPLEVRNGAPLRLIVPGWYGIANVKWLARIEAWDRRYMGRFMGRDYVTVRGQRSGNEITFVESSVTKMNLKSVVARVTRRPAAEGRVPLKAYGAAWGDGTEIARVEVKLDDGPWREARLDAEPRARFCWVFFSIDLGNVAPGKHLLTSRAIDANGRVQPAENDDEIALKKTYWEAYAQWPREIEV
jgi:DMSO/TMAO reductase YedYZ molybdopterin-dependent catalytic subunit